MNEFQATYQKAAKSVQKEFGLKNVHQLPKIKKVVVNVGIGKHYNTVSKDFAFIEDNIVRITGQKPSVRDSRLSVSNFKMREGTPNGLMVTLRGERMYDFLNKLINVTLPRVRDFRGISAKAFDKQGNYSLGIREHTVFPEALVSETSKPFSLQATVVIDSQSKEHSFALLKELGFPFSK